MNYSEGIRHIEIVAPHHPLLSMLQQGESAINQMYLSQVLKEVPAAVTPKPAVQACNTDDAYRQLKELQIKKNKIRNSYFVCRTDEDRKSINRQLIQMRDDIHRLSRRIEYYEKNGEFPTIPDAAPAALATSDPVELQRKLMNVRSNISRYKKKIKIAYDQKASKDDIEKLEKRLQGFINKKNLIEHTIISTESTS